MNALRLPVPWRLCHLIFSHERSGAHDIMNGELLSKGPCRGADTHLPVGCLDHLPAPLENPQLSLKEHVRTRRRTRMYVLVQRIRRNKLESRWPNHALWGKYI